MYIYNMRNILRIFSILMISLGGEGSCFAQLCGYDHVNLFILDIRKEGETNQAKGIEVFLADMNKKIVHENSAPNASVKIVENTKIKAGRKTRYPCAGNYYAVEVSNVFPRAELPPVYYAMIINKSDTSFYHLPFEKSLSICGNHLYSDADMSLLLMQTDGQPFTPIRIDPSKKESPKKMEFPISNAKLNPIIARDNRKNSSELFYFEKIEVYDYQSMTLIQEVIPSEKFHFTQSEYSQHFKTIAPFDSLLSQISSFAVTTRIDQKGTQRPRDIYRDYFLFDHRQQAYRKWTMLSEYPNVIIEPDGKLTRMEYETKQSKLISKKYSFDGEQWQLDKTEETEIYVSKEESVKVFSDQHNDNSQALKISNDGWFSPTIIDTPLPYQFSYDTLYITNEGNKTISLKLSNNATSEIIIPQAIAPHRTLPIVLRKTGNGRDDEIQNRKFECTISASNGQSFQLHVNYFVAGSKVEKIHNQSGALVSLRNVQTNNMSSFEVRVNEKGIPISSGHILSKTGEQIGEWHNILSNGQLGQTQYFAKRFILQLSNADQKLENLKPEIHDNNKWRIPEFQVLNDGLMFYCTPETDSIRVVSQNKTAQCDYHFKDAPTNGGTQLYFISEGEETIKLANTEVPIMRYANRYLIFWSFPPYSSENSTYIGPSQYLPVLKKKFPKAVFGPSPISDTSIEVELTNMTEIERKEILNALIKDKYVYFLSQIVKPGNNGETCADKDITIQFRNEVVPMKYKEIVESYGFSAFTQSWGTTHLYSATFNENICDEALYQALKKLQKVDGILYAQPNFYYQALPEQRIEGVDALPYDSKD